MKDALAHLRAGAELDALADLLVAWRVTRSARIADAIAAVDHLVLRGRPAIAGASQGARHAAWFALEAVGDPADVGRLLELATDGYPARCVERIARLESRAPDPRIAAAMIRLIAEPPAVAWVNPSGVAIWDTVADVLAHHLDPRSVRALRAMAWLFDRTLESQFRARTRTRLTARIAALLDGAVGDEPAIDPADAAICDEILALLDPDRGRGATLLAAVLDHPRDRAARAVYADWLIEHGDPRGEFIALQLARVEGAPRSARERALEATHAKAWLGAVATHIEYWVFRDGFLAECQLVGVAPPDPGFATVEKLSVDFENDPAVLAVALDPVWRGLRELGTLDWPALVRLGNAPHPLAIERIRLDLPTSIPPLDALPALPALRILELEGGVSDATAAQLLALPAFARVRELHVGWISGLVARWCDAFAASALDHLAIEWNQFWNLDLWRREGRVHLVAHVRHGGYGPEAAERHGTMRAEVFDSLAESAATASTSAVHDVTLVDGRWYGDTPAPIATLSATLALLTGCPITVTAEPRRKARG